MGNLFKRHTSRISCFFACCKGQIIIRTSEVDSAEIEDIEENVKKNLRPPPCLAIFFAFMWSNRMWKDYLDCRIAKTS